MKIPGFNAEASLYVAKHSLFNAERSVNNVTSIRPRKLCPLKGDKKENMLHIYCMQNRFNLSDRQLEDALYEIERIRRFAALAVTDALPDETTIY